MNNSSNTHIRRSLQKLSKEFEKGGEKRGAAKRIAESLQNDLKDFMNDSIPLMLLICSPGMKERHWQEIEDSTGVTITKGGSYTLSMMTEIGASLAVLNVLWAVLKCLHASIVSYTCNSHRYDYFDAVNISTFINRFAAPCERHGRYMCVC